MPLPGSSKDIEAAEIHKLTQTIIVMVAKIVLPHHISEEGATRAHHSIQINHGSTRISRVQ